MEERILTRSKICVLLIGLSVTPSLAFQTSDVKKDTSSSDLSDIWLNTVWKSVDEITTDRQSFDVEKVTTVAGVRGVEAEDEATRHLYYRGSIRAPDRLELQEAIKRLEILIASERNPDRVPELKHYVIQCYLRLGDQRTVRELTEELVREYPDSEWAALYEQ